MSVTFDKKTTAEQVASTFASEIKGKTIIVTGPSPGGLGFETARVLAKHEPGVLVLAGRSESKLKETASAIAEESPSANVRLLILDLGSLEQIRKAAAEVNAYSEPSVDILINNAAVMACPYGTTVDGFETQFGTNHLGHFLFTNLIMSKLTANGGARIVNVSSSGHRGGDVRYDDPGFDGGKAYEKWAAYGQGKTANMLFTVGLAQRYKSMGITSLSLHPGGIYTPLQRHFSDDEYSKFRSQYNAYNEDNTPNMESGIWKTLGEGAATQVRAAVDPSLAADSGSFMWDCVVANHEAKDYALDPENAKKLWSLSEELVKQKFE